MPSSISGRFDRLVVSLSAWLLTVASLTASGPAASAVLAGEHRPSEPAVDKSSRSSRARLRLPVVADHAAVAAAWRTTGDRSERESGLPGVLPTGQTARQPRRARSPGVRRISITWSAAPLRQALRRLGSTQRRTVLLDRRVDPEMRLRLTVEDQPFEAVLASIANQTDLRLDWIGPVAYLGPPQPLRHLSAVAASRRLVARKLPADSRKRWLAKNSLKYSALTTPAELVRRLALAAKAELRQIERMPHDLWPAGEIPPISLTDRLTLVTYGFGLSFELNDRGDTVRLVPITDIPLTNIGETSRRSKKSGLAAGRRAEKRQQRSAQQLYTLRVKEQPIGQLLEQLGQKLRLDFVIDAESLDRQGISLKTRVSLQVRQATLDQLLAAVLGPAHLSYRRDGQKIHIERSSE